MYVTEFHLKFIFEFLIKYLYIKALLCFNSKSKTSIIQSSASLNRYLKFFEKVGHRKRNVKIYNLHIQENF